MHNLKMVVCELTRYQLSRLPWQQKSMCHHFLHWWKGGLHIYKITSQVSRVKQQTVNAEKLSEACVQIRHALLAAGTSETFQWLKSFLVILAYVTKTAVLVRLSFHWCGPMIGSKHLNYWHLTPVLQVWTSGVSLLITRPYALRIYSNNETADVHERTFQYFNLLSSKISFDVGEDQSK